VSARRSRDRSFADRVGSLVCGLALAWCLVPSALAQPTDRDRWVVAQSENFTLYSNAKADKTRQIANSLEQLRQIIEHLGSDVSQIERAPITFILFRDEKAFLPYMRTPPPPGTVRPSEGHYGEDRDFVLLDAGRPPAEVFPWAYEAYSLYLIDLQYRELPFWLRVGLASFYGTADVDARGTVRIGAPVERHVRQLREHAMIPLAQFFRVEAESSFLNDPNNLRTYNAQVWAIAHLLMTGGGAEDPTAGRQVFQSLSAGASPETAIQDAYGLELAAFEKRLYTYIRQPTMPVFTLDGDFLTDSDVALEEIGNDEASYQLGSYLVSAHDPPSIALVEAHLEPIIEAEGPRRADALAALAQLRRVTGRPDEASALFEQAMTDSPVDALSYYRAADFLISRRSQDTEAMRRYLKRAVDIEPGFARAWLALAASYEGSTELEEGIPLIEGALAHLPSQPNLAYNLAIMQLNAGDSAAAQATVERYLVGSPEYRDRARKAIERTTAANEQLDAYNAAIAIANEGRYEEALQRLRELLPGIEDRSLKATVEQTMRQLEGSIAEKDGPRGAGGGVSLLSYLVPGGGVGGKVRFT
jgi:tetratricopeptide (TPR) repeat protein